MIFEGWIALKFGVVTSLRILLEDVLDYAGLFPPAGLPMEEATDLFAAYRKGSQRWIAQRFVCPVAWLTELVPHLDKITDEPWPLTVLGSSIEGFRQDQALIEKFENEAGVRAEVIGFEVKAKSEEITKAMLMPLLHIGFEDVFLELPLNEIGFDALPMLAEYDEFGIKARTGGLDAAAFPSSGAVARFLRECVDLGLRMKMTAGLHHPVRHFDSTLGAKVHGFLNVLCAGTLAESQDLATREIEDLLNIEEIGQFEFTEDGFTFAGHQATNDDIGLFREGFVSIGSCSIDEPLEDLAKLNLIPSEVNR